MEISFLISKINWLEHLIENALKSEYPPEFTENHTLIRWSIKEFLERYLSVAIYPADRIEYLVYSLFDIKIELYYLLEVEPGLANRLVIDSGYNATDRE